MADDVFHHHDRVIDHKPHRNRQPHDRQVVEAVAHQVHHRKGPDQRQRNGQRRNQRCRGFAQEHKDHDHHQPNGQQQRELHVVDRGFDGLRAVTDHLHVDVTRQRRGQRRQARLDVGNGRQHVETRLFVDVDNDPRLALNRRRLLRVFGAIDDLAQVAEFDRHAVFIGDHLLAVALWVQQLVGGTQGDRTVLTVKAAFGLIQGAEADHAAHVFQGQATGRQRIRINLHPHRRFLLAMKIHQTDTGHLRELLRQVVICVHVQLVQGAGRRGQGQRQHGEFRRVDLVEGRGAGHGFRQISAGTADRGLHVLGCAVDVTVQIELQHDLGFTGRAGGGHRGDLRHRGERALQRRRH